VRQQRSNSAYCCTYIPVSTCVVINLRVVPLAAEGQSSMCRCCGVCSKLVDDQPMCIKPPACSRNSYPSPTACSGNSYPSPTACTNPALGVAATPPFLQALRPPRTPSAGRCCCWPPTLLLRRGCSLSWPAWAWLQHLTRPHLCSCSGSTWLR
jgi:hypothetical protein